ncbi:MULTISPECIES: hypothetical protein [unclassified Mesorhizobium]|uniref:hypothetical protein n=1 Tax=unclassified Mesorhizobium TaxID=325217 RepID=UPI000FCB6408|nr:MULTISPECIES: hypothetical protein [unclassified Mesorhizobium]RUV98959.1 hypothetical protein EOA49_21945 [Mesorhizobium sp. M1A.F.Ca.IN.020.04.1.1]RUW07805.1 hypothetical protein EOA53_20200 [Mesorhizobium sp. M1A.F.Ca.IN.020.03.1.1]RWF71656.1 MAG: hypothetical protein EOQ34_14750 [Mesorhizobium sp.]RWG11998.1 MAG: hypothetical protein EOQ58_22275 [Mesorhizobium sp.]RWG29054.1 MAG: hypothetical protein EOQ61_19465 [Mesorhizobium sp.]
MDHKIRHRGIAIGAAVFLAMLPVVAHAEENCVHLDFFVKGKWMPRFDVSTWAAGHPTVDFGKVRLRVQPDGVAIYQDRLDNRETKATWEVRPNSGGMEQLCLPNNPFDPDLECAALYKAAAENDPATLLAFDGHCANGDAGSLVFVGAEQGLPDTPTTTAAEPEAATPNDSGDDSEADDGTDQTAVDEQPNGQLPKCSADAVKETVSNLVASIPLDPGQIYAMIPVRPHKLIFTVKAVRTEGELLNGYSCSAVVAANLDASGSPPISPLAIPLLQSQGVIGDRNIDYSIKMMDDGQVMVTLEP